MEKTAAIKKVLFVRPPALMWPMINESDNFLMPLGFPCVAAYLRERLPDIEYKVVDCMPHKIGWKSLYRILEDEKPDVIGFGDMICHVKDGMRVAGMAKELNPEVITVGGGHFHSQMPEYSFKEYPQLDYVVRFEGEEGMVQLISALLEGRDLDEVGNLAYRNEEGGMTTTHILPLIEPLDSLPYPALDLMPVEMYSPFGWLWPKAFTMQLGRGCPYGCTFCCWTALEGKHTEVDGKIRTEPTYRAKSAERILEEIDRNHQEYGMDYIFWVDGSWNYSNELMEAISEGIIERGYKLGMFAFARADKLIEQHSLGILRKMVKAGFCHIITGQERAEEDDLDMIGKPLVADALMECSHLLKREYPEIFRQGTFVTGIFNDTPEKLERIGRYSREAELDFVTFHPLQPYPGTSLWEEANRRGVIEEWDFSRYDMYYPITRSETMSREEISKHTEKLHVDFVRKNPLRFFFGFFSPHKIRRKLKWWFAFTIVRVLVIDLWLSIKGRRRFSGFASVNKSWEPDWHNS